MTEKAGIIARLQAAGLRPKKVFGQNFLHDPKLLSALVDAAEIPADGAVFEIGTGPGTLTRHLASRASRVLSIEIDADLARFAERELSEHTNVEILVRDVLAKKSQMDPDVVAKLEALGPFAWVSNLPYSVATPTIIALLESGLPWQRAVLTLQLEVAERLVAEPGDAAYGGISALVRYFAEARIERKIGAGTFWPRPTVESAAIVLTPRDDPDRELYPSFKAWVKHLFSGRRKQLRRLLRDRLGDADLVARALEIGGWAPEARAESFAVDDFVRLAREFR